jgi:hypothetical protein
MHLIKKTKNFQKRGFKWNETEYRVVDTIGIGDINLTKKKVIYEKIAEIIHLMPEGISQILFVIDRKFSTEEANTLNLFKDFIFDCDIAEYITIVRTKFGNFKNEDECGKDKEYLCNENDTIARLSKSIVYVDNPPINISDDDSDDGDDKINKLKRVQSRLILLDHLDKVSRNKYYELKTWDKLHSRYNKEANKTLKLLKRLILVIPSFFKLNSNTPGREKTRNLLIIGRTGSGKFTLSDLLCGTNGTVKKDFQQKSFELKSIKYRVIEIRIKLIEKNLLYSKIGEIINSMPEGISQILFVVDGRFTVEEVETFKVFGKVIFESGIVEHTTIVRTKFANFEKKSECEKDKKELCKENEIISKIIESCRGIVYVDNPPKNIRGVERREKSRNILLCHLKTVCHKYYKLRTWDKLHTKITSHMKESGITSTLGDFMAAEVESNLISEIPAFANVNFVAYRNYCIENTSRKILKG